MKNRAAAVDLILLFAIGALVYLPLIHRIGFTHDDWYLMYSAGAKGAEVFHEIYSGDRPLRAYVLVPAFEMFGQNVLYYNLSAWMFRVLSACLFLWLLRMLWRGQSRWTMGVAVLYLIYPGFLSQPNGVDYLPQMVSLTLAMLSIALTAYAYFQKNTIVRWGEMVIAVLLGIFYLGLVEYEVGFEAMRLGVLFLLVSRAAFGYRERISSTFQSWIPYSLVIFGFGFWRIFLFAGDRKATDVSFQFEGLRLYPLQTAYGWIVQVVQDFFDVTLSAFVIPLSQLTGHIQRWGGVLAILIACAAILVFNKMQDEKQSDETDQGSLFSEAMLLGFVAVIGGLIPIAMVNREVYFPSFSRYALMSSFGVAMVIVAFLTQVNGIILRNFLMAGLVLISTLTHHANAVKYAQETETVNDFWWQVAWRAPQFEKNTTLVAHIPGVATEEDYFVWGPANLVYYPESQNDEAVRPALFAAVLNPIAVQNILARQPQEYDNRRGIITYKNYRNIVILTQPSPDSCAHALHGLQPEYSANDPDSIRVIGSFSEFERVLVDASPHAPPELIFGSEPARGWCYYYQKADLARQRADWESVIRLGSEAQANGFAPSDLIEWMPFLHAYAVTGDVERLMELAPVISSQPYVALQVCQNIGGLQGISAAVAEVIDAQYCFE